MSFNVSADAYGASWASSPSRSPSLFAEQAGRPPRTAGAGRGLRARRADRGPGEQPGAARVSAVDPSASFAAAVRERLPGVSVARSAAERLPFPDGAFDVVLAQLVVHFMADPVAGLREMARVARPAGRRRLRLGPRGRPRAAEPVLARRARPGPGGRRRVGPGRSREGHLASLCEQAGLSEVRATSLTVRVHHADFEQWWEPFTLGVGPAGAYLAALDHAGRAALREQCRRRLPEGAFEVSATAWAATGRV